MLHPRLHKMIIKEHLYANKCRIHFPVVGFGNSHQNRISRTLTIDLAALHSFKALSIIYSLAMGLFDVYMHACIGSTQFNHHISILLF